MSFYGQGVQAAAAMFKIAFDTPEQAQRLGDILIPFMGAGSSHEGTTGLVSGLLSPDRQGLRYGLRTGVGQGAGALTGGLAGIALGDLLGKRDLGVLIGTSLGGGIGAHLGRESAKARYGGDKKDHTGKDEPGRPSPGEKTEDQKKEAAGRFNNPQAMRAQIESQRLGAAWKAHNPGAAAGAPVTSNVALTKPADTVRANDLSYWTGQAGGAQAPVQPQRLTGMDKIRAMQQQKLGQEVLAVFGTAANNL